MSRIFLVWIYSIALLLGQTSPLKTFYSFLDQDHIVRMEIDFYQKQFDDSYRSSGFFYLIGKKNYVYDSLSFQMIVKDSLVTTINHETNQVVYSSIEKGQLTILDILSGRKDYVEFLDETAASNVKNFNIPDLDYSGSFEFDQDTGLIKMIKLNIDYNQNVSITVISIEAIENYIEPDFDLNRFEIIDLRG